MFVTRSFTLAILSQTFVISSLSALGGDEIRTFLNDRTLNLKKKNDRAQVARQIRDFENQRLKKVHEKGRELGLALEEQVSQYQSRELVGFDEEGPIYRYTRNYSAAVSTNAQRVWTSPHDLDGRGLIIGLWDSGVVRASHQEFATGNRVTVIDSASEKDHATHIAGTLGAFGVDPTARGMANAVQIHSYTSSNDISEMTTAGADAPGQAATKVYTSNHSYGPNDGWRSSDGVWQWGGTGTDQNAYDKDFGRYSGNSSSIDSLIYSTPYLLSFWACGNDRTDGPGEGDDCEIDGETLLYDAAIHPQNDGLYRGGYETINAESIGKNVIAVGAVNDAAISTQRNLANATLASFSSTGPADDGRIKPDLVANGVGMRSTGKDADDNYFNSQGTSMATPNACGSATLLVDQYQRLFNSTMRASTLKALLIHTADDLGNPGPDYQFGWGLVNVKRAADLVANHATYPAVQQIAENNLSAANPTRSYSFTWDGSSPLSATVAWTDPAASSMSGHDSRTPALINDLNLKLVAPDGTEFLPYIMPFVGTWTVQSMSANATTGINQTDNVEQIEICESGTDRHLAGCHFTHRPHHQFNPGF